MEATQRLEELSRRVSSFGQALGEILAFLLLPLLARFVLEWLVTGY